MIRGRNTKVLVAVVVVAVAAAGVVAAWGAADAQQTADADNRTVTVTASGQAQAEPDVALVHVGVTATADDPSTATERLAANASTMREALLNATLSEDQIRTTDFNVFEERRDDRPEPAAQANQSVRYVARQGFEIQLNDTSRVGEIIDLAVQNGATEVRGVTFTLSEDRRAELRDQALSEAVSDARGQAETLADAAGLSLDGVRSISTGGSQFIPFERGLTAEAADAGTTIDSGPVSVFATVQVTWDAAPADGAPTTETTTTEEPTAPPNETTVTPDNVTVDNETIDNDTVTNDTVDNVTADDETVGNTTAGNETNATV